VDNPARQEILILGRRIGSLLFAGPGFGWFRLADCLRSIGNLPDFLNSLDADELEAAFLCVPLDHDSRAKKDDGSNKGQA